MLTPLHWEEMTLFWFSLESLEMNEGNMSKKNLISMLDSKRAFLSTWRETLRRLHQSYSFLFSDYFDIYAVQSTPFLPDTKDHWVLGAFPQLSTSYLRGELWFCVISSRSGCWYLTPCPLIGCFKFCHAWPSACYQLTLARATTEKISPGS